MNQKAYHIILLFLISLFIPSCLSLTKLNDTDEKKHNRFKKVDAFYISENIDRKFLAIPLSSWAANFEIKNRKQYSNPIIKSDFNKIYSDLLVPFITKKIEMEGCYKTKENPKCTKLRTFESVKKCSKDESCSIKTHNKYVAPKDRRSVLIEIFRTTKNKKVTLSDIHQKTLNLSQSDRSKCKGSYHRAYRGRFYNDYNYPFTLLVSVCNSEKNGNSKKQNFIKFQSHRLIIVDNKIYKISYTNIRKDKFIKEPNFYLKDFSDEVSLGGSFTMCDQESLSSLCKMILTKQQKIYKPKKRKRKKGMAI